MLRTEGEGEDREAMAQALKKDVKRAAPPPARKSATPKPGVKKIVHLTAADLAEKQREISVSEFFTKNRHLLGFDSPAKALLTTIKEAVDNSLDACEEAGILPEVRVEIHQLSEPNGNGGNGGGAAAGNGEGAAASDGGALELGLDDEGG